MADIKPLADIESKWKDVTPRSEPYYSKGLAGKGTKWEANTAAAGASWKSGVDTAG